MLRLILMRHAKSDWSHAGAPDHDRPLNKRGKASAKALGLWMKREGYIPDEILCSSAQRTGETLAGLGLGPVKPTRFTRALYLAEAHEMCGVLHQATRSCVLMIGHNPGTCDYAHRLVKEPPPHARFEDYPTGATLVCDFDAASWTDVDWQQGKVVDFTVPRDLITQT